MNVSAGGQPDGLARPAIFRTSSPLDIVRAITVSISITLLLLLLLHTPDLRLMVARVTGFAIFLVVIAGVGQGQGVVGVRGLGAVALTQLTGLRVGGQGVGVAVQIGSALAPAEEIAAEEAALGIA